MYDLLIIWRTKYIATTLLAAFRPGFAALCQTAVHDCLTFTNVHTVLFVSSYVH